MEEDAEDTVVDNDELELDVGEVEETGAAAVDERDAADDLETVVDATEDEVGVVAADARDAVAGSTAVPAAAEPESDEPPAAGGR